MAFAPLGKFIPRSTPKPLGRSVQVALAIEAGHAYLAREAPALTGTVRLISIKNGVVRAIANSASAAHELGAYRDRVFAAVKTATNLTCTDLRVEVRGTLDSEERF